MPRPSLPPLRRRALPGPDRPATSSRSGPVVMLAGLLLVALVSAGCQSARAAERDRRHRGTTTTTAAQGGATTTTAAGDQTTTTAGGQGTTTTTLGAQPDPLATSCDQSKLPLHNGFQDAPRCVAVDDGEVAALTPAVMISQFPRLARAGQAFQVGITSRNLVRDRFLAAAVGGYYHEMSVLNGEGVERGHLHVYVQALTDGSDVPDADASPLEFFKAVEDGGGGAGLSRVSVSVDGLTAGSKRLCVTAGDGSHRVPMMRAAKLAAAVDCVRIRVV